MTPTEEALSTGRFVTARPNGKQLKCAICGSLGYPFGTWYEQHKGPHDVPCEDCDRGPFINQKSWKAHRAAKHRLPKT